MHCTGAADCLDLEVGQTGIALIQGRPAVLLLGTEEARGQRVQPAHLLDTVLFMNAAHTGQAPLRLPCWSHLLSTK